MLSGEHQAGTPRGKRENRCSGTLRLAYLTMTLLALLATMGPVRGQIAGPARTGRFTRGSGDDPYYQSLLIPLDFQKGMPLDNVDGNATNLFGSAWGGSTILYHYNAT